MLATVIIVIIVLVLLVIYFTLIFQYSTWNTSHVTVTDYESYRVHRAHTNTKDAAQLLREINKRNTILFAHLREKYLAALPASSPDNFKNGRIDIVPLSRFYEEHNDDAISQEYIQERVIQLIANYSPARMYEISPRNAGDATSYTEDKRTLVLCLRKKKPNEVGEYTLHDINTMMFVVLHELTHMANKHWQHRMDFWTLFKFMLINAVEAGIYDPIDYAHTPLNYCGLDLNYNPYFDQNV